MPDRRRRRGRCVAVEKLQGDTGRAADGARGQAVTADLDGDHRVVAGGRRHGLDHAGVVGRARLRLLRVAGGPAAGELGGEGASADLPADVAHGAGDDHPARVGLDPHRRTGSRRLPSSGPLTSIEPGVDHVPHEARLRGAADGERPDRA